MRIVFTEEEYLKIKGLEEGADYLMGVPCTLEFSLRIKMGLGYPDQINIYRFKGYIEDPNSYIYNYNGLHPGLIFSKFWIKSLPGKIIKSIIKNILSRYKSLPQTKREKDSIYKEFNIYSFRDFLFDELKSLIVKDLRNIYNKFLFEKIIKGDVFIE